MKRSKLPKVKPLSHEDLQSLLLRMEQNRTTLEDKELVRQLAESVVFICDSLHRKEVRLKTLLKQILGIKSEKTKKVKENLGIDADQPKEASNADHDEENQQVAASDAPSDDKPSQPEPETQKRKGHGRIKANTYTGAERIPVCHPGLCTGDHCPECLKGKIYRQKQPGVFIHITGSPPLQATIYELEKLRCNLCGEIFQAQPPDHVKKNATGSKHYDETATSMIPLLRYGTGLPMVRLAELQSRLGVPLPVSTQWDKISAFGDQLTPLYDAIINRAAQGDLFYNDDTGMKVLSLIKEIAEETRTRTGKIRTGIFTTGIISEVEAHRIALYFSGRKHAGENISDLLEKRQEGLSPPIQMSDAKSGNTPRNIEVIESNCNTHARRNFVKVAEDFPDECLYVITDVFGKVYHTDSLAKEKRLTPEERLELHREKSGPVMECFYLWLKRQFSQKLVENNSSLGKAIQYTLNHWKKLTRFLQIPGVPLDNNICERMLKKAILHRKNSLFYKTKRGARLGDLFMSLIGTCQLADINPFDYLTQLQIHAPEVARSPEQWFPWNYQETIAHRSNRNSA